MAPGSPPNRTRRGWQTASNGFRGEILAKRRVASKPPAKMADVTVLIVVFKVAAALGAVHIMHFFRARAMRRFASRWGLGYKGPAAPPQWWFNTSRPKIPSPLPGWISRLGISQAWNIIEGKNNGTSVFVFGPQWRFQKSTLHLYRLPNRTKSIRNEYVGRTGDADARMDGPSWGVVPLVLLAYGYRAA